MKYFRVGVFERPGSRKVAVVAYTLWYSPTWPGCCEHEVSAINGTLAKQIAIAEHRATCMTRGQQENRA